MEIRELVILWNRKYKLDFLFRKKHNIRFNSREHRETNPISMCFELIEDQMFKEASKPPEIKQRKEENDLFDQIELE